MPDSAPRHVKTVVVPVAHPDHAAALLLLANTLADPVDGRIIALYVAGNSEEAAADLAQLEPLVTGQAENGIPVILQTRIATSLTRGIMDTLREEDADLLLVGASKQGTRFVLSAISENIARSAPCDVLIYRTTQKNGIERLLLPADGSGESRAAAAYGIQIAKQRDVPIEAVHIDRRSDMVRDADARLSLTLRGLADEGMVRRRALIAESPVDAVLARIDSETLVVVGISHEEMEADGLESAFINKLLNAAPGGVLVAISATEDGATLGFWKRSWRHISLNLTEVEQDELEWQADRLAAPSIDFFVLAAIAATLATVGLLLNSATVIIGAMLVAPLMQPLIAMAVATSSGKFKLLLHSARTLALGMLTSLVVAIVIARLVGTQVLTPEILGRTNPTLADLVVALASGIIAAYATVRKDIPAALAGVAVAAALMPPMCVVGLNIAFGNLLIAERAALLFLANITSITAAALLTFMWVGIRHREAHNWRWIALGLVALAFAGTVGLGAIVARSNERPALEAILREAFAPAEVVGFDIIPSTPPRVLATLRSVDPIDVARVREVQRQINETLVSNVQLEVVVQTLLDPEE